MTKMLHLKTIACLLFILIVAECRTSNDIHSLRNEVETDPEMEKYLREALENFREQMKEGIPAIHVPVLDPLELQNLNIHLTENLAEMDLRIKQISVSGLSMFNITNLKPSLENLFLAINLTLPELFVNGNYSVDGRLLKILPIYGSGRFQINATDVCIAGKAQLLYANDTLQMSLLKLDLLWQNLSVFLENFLGGGDFSEVLQRVVPAVGRDVFVAYRPHILSKFEEALTAEINEKLDDPVVKDMISGLLPENEDD